MKRIFLWIMCILGLQLSAELYSFNIKLLKGTHTICPNPYYAPFWGLAFHEGRIAEQMYDFTSDQVRNKLQQTFKILPVIAENNPYFKGNLPLIHEFEALDPINKLPQKKDTMTEELVSNLFYRANGVFKITNAVDTPVRFFTPQIIGGILRVVWQYDLKNVGQEKNQNYFKKLFEELHSYLLSTELMKTGIPGRAPRKFLRKDYMRFVNSFVDALKESTGPNALYPENTAQGLLLGYFLAKFSTRQHLQEYFQGLLGDPNYVLTINEFTEQELKLILYQQVNTANMQSFGDYVCAVVYSKNYSSLFPKMATFRDVKYKGHSFPNCFETMLANVINIITFDSKNNRMGKVPEGFTLSPELQEFYKNEDHCSNLDVDNQQVLEDWLNLFENKINCFYKNIFNPSSEHGQKLTISDDYEAFIPVKETAFELSVKEMVIDGVTYQFFEKIVDENKKYLLVPVSLGLNCCELRSSFSNFVVILSDLLNYEPYVSLDALFDWEVLKPKLKNLWTKLGWQSQITVTPPTDYAPKCSTINFENQSGIRFSLDIFENNVGKIQVSSGPELNLDKIVVENNTAVFAVCAAFNFADMNWFFSGKFKDVVLLSRFIPVFGFEVRFELIRQLMIWLENNNSAFIQLEGYLFRLLVSMGYLNMIYTDLTNETETLNEHKKIIINLSLFLNNVNSSVLSDDLLQAFVLTATIMNFLNCNEPMVVVLRLLLGRFNKQQIDAQYSFLSKNALLYLKKASISYGSPISGSIIVQCLLDLYQKDFITKQVLFSVFMPNPSHLYQYIVEQKVDMSSRSFLFNALIEQMAEPNINVQIFCWLCSRNIVTIDDILESVRVYISTHPETNLSVARNVLIMLSMMPENIANSFNYTSYMFVQGLVLDILQSQNSVEYDQKIVSCLSGLANNGILESSEIPFVLNYLSNFFDSSHGVGVLTYYTVYDLVNLCSTLVRKNLIVGLDIEKMKFILRSSLSYIQNMKEVKDDYSVAEKCKKLLDQLIIMSPSQGMLTVHKKKVKHTFPFVTVSQSPVHPEQVQNPE